MNRGGAAGDAANESPVQHAWYRAKTAVTKQGVAVPLLFRLAATSDRKNYMAKHRTRNLWKMPVRQALAVASGAAPAEDGGGVKKHRRRGEGRAGGKQAQGKRSRTDADGDEIMVRALGHLAAWRPLGACTWTTSQHVYTATSSCVCVQTVARGGAGPPCACSHEPYRCRDCGDWLL
jgi:hypothetical protein